jgi:hypothetical protein
LIDYHCPKAVRILDFPHAAEYLTALGTSVYGEQTEALQQWLVDPCHRLKHEGGQALLPDLHAWSERQPQPDSRAEALAYLDKRVAHMAYPDFRAQGWPIGSGAVESANKLVVEARLKGAGMHWARAHVDPMLALRNVVCNDRWDEAWQQIVAELRAQRQRQRQARHQPPLPAPRPLPPKLGVINAAPPETDTALMPTPATAQPTKPYRPAPNHPWRKSFLPGGRSRSSTNLPKS